VKNRQRWTFGGLYPRSYSEAQSGSDAWAMQTECLVRGDCNTSIRVKVRFLHLMARSVGKIDSACGESQEGEEPAYRIVESLQVGDRLIHAWQEAVEREVIFNDILIPARRNGPRRKEFAFSANRQTEIVRSPRDEAVGVIVREQQSIAGTVEVSTTPVAVGLCKLRVRIENHVAIEDGQFLDRDAALMRSLVSTHTILEVDHGEFVSLLDPPDAERELAADCQNIGAWPVLVGEPGQHDTILSSPIILYDYPQVAPESPGDLFDSTEIDEILILRILTMTDAEKRAAAAVDERVRALLYRNESMAMEQLAGLHGAVRGLQLVNEEAGHE
jgi:hypothetical protein